MKISDSLRKARRSRNLSQEKLSTKSGVALKSIMFYEEGRQIPRLQNALYLADTLDMSLQELITGTPAPYKRKILSLEDIGLTVDKYIMQPDICITTLCQNVKINHDTIYRIRRGTVNSMIDKYLILADYLGLTLDELVGRV